MKSTKSSATSSKKVVGEICHGCVGKMKIKTLADAAEASKSVRREAKVAGTISEYGAIGLLHLAKLHFESMFHKDPASSTQLVAGLFARFETILARRLHEEVGDDEMSRIYANLIVNLNKIGIDYVPPAK